MTKLEKTFFISPGNFYISNNPEIILETCLGSCVGVALYDAVNKVGGIIHIVLPEGDKKKMLNHPTRYAVSGIPFLIKEMTKLGASRSFLTATIVGGASLSKDTNIKIGQRNIDKVREVLAREGIPILEEDLGGSFSRLFRLRIKDGKVTLTQIGKRISETIPATSTKIELKEILEKVDQIRPLSKTVQEVLKIINAEPNNVEEVKKVVLKDQALTTNILKVCNSAYYGLSQRVSNLSHAIILLGFQTVKKILLAVSLKSTLDRKIDVYDLKRGELFKHALACALTAELIAKEKQYKDPEVVFTAALLHDLGKVVLDQCAFEQFALIMNKVAKEKKAFWIVEKEILGFDHAQIGGLIAQRWKLPQILIEAITLHHSPEKAKFTPEVVSIVHIADVICSMLGIGCGVDGLNNPIHPYALSLLAFNSSEIDNIVEKLPEFIEEIKTFEEI
ncbi:MAG TPA: HDOD domain-containing protein [Candidatus Desulfofervidus auxilii]|uniref:Probable chemoreceptor glutamine deamidase CheD n=1 Tax=Desulfofervidus auxilii TaxID=1621989 RepID=A0A7C0U3N0_DESA2|nr:HDOD domain-containing protein [Candidatus Desulfofervidus auxilii]